MRGNQARAQVQAESVTLGGVKSEQCDSNCLGISCHLMPSSSDQHSGHSSITFEVVQLACINPFSGTPFARREAQKSGQKHHLHLKKQDLSFTKCFFAGDANAWNSGAKAKAETTGMNDNRMRLASPYLADSCTMFHVRVSRIWSSGFVRGAVKPTQTET